MLDVVDGLGGILQDDEMRRAVRTALCDSTRQLRQRVQRREQEFDHAHSLSEQGLQNLRTLTFVDPQDTRGLAPSGRRST